MTTAARQPVALLPRKDLANDCRLTRETVEMRQRPNDDPTSAMPPTPPTGVDDLGCWPMNTDQSLPHEGSVVWLIAMVVFVTAIATGAMWVLSVVLVG